ncbi:UNVERIFIED_CONTAM: type IV fimbrial biogenesis protein FimT [Acidovorax defluvii]
MMNKTAAHRRNGGFTLIELMVTIALAAALMTISAPSFVQYQRNSELTSLTNSLLAAINAAKGEAMKTGRNAFVIPLGTGWNSGWVVYVDMNRDNTYTEGTDITVQKQDAVKSYFNITGNSIAAGSTPYIKFDNTGYSTDTGAAPVALTLSIARNDTPSANAAEESRRVVVARTGRVRTCKPSTDTTCTSSATY